MSIVELRSDSRVWPSSQTSPAPITSISGHMPEATWNSAWRGPSRLEAFLPFLTGACLFLVDVGLVVGAFMLSYWVRFVASDNELAALGLIEYLRVGVTVALLTSGLFALRGLYDQPRPVVWATRLHTIVSALSTALIISLTLSFFAGDQAFSRCGSPLVGSSPSLPCCCGARWRCTCISPYAQPFRPLHVC